MKSEWILFGSGKQYNKQKKITDLWTGKFVEVIGAPESGRTGHRQRVVATKGWCVTELGEILPLDELHYNGANKPEFTAKEWSVKRDKFYMKTGGFRGRVVEKGHVTKETVEGIPYYLSEVMMRQLYVLPAHIRNPTTEVKSSNSAVVTVTIDKLGTDAKATIYWGDKDGLTYDNKGSGFLWANKREVTITKGENSYKIDGINSHELYWRLRVVNNEGETWLDETQHISLDR